MEPHHNLRREYLDKGFVVLRSLYEKNKIRELRSSFIAKANTDEEILTHDIVQDLLLQNNLISKIKTLLNTDKLLYYSDSNIVNKEMPFKTKNGFHNDARFEDETIPYDQEYPILRLAIYFEDHQKFSGGLKIKEKSHNYFCFNLRAIKENLLKVAKILFTKTRYKLSSLKFGKSINLDLKEGDVVIWNLRTHHCGVSRRLKVLPKLCLQPNFEKFLPSIFFLKTQYKRDRCSVFCTFAKNDISNKNVYNYIKNKMNLGKIDQIKSDQSLIHKLNKLDLILPNLS